MSGHSQSVGIVHGHATGDRTASLRRCCAGGPFARARRGLRWSAERRAVQGGQSNPTFKLITPGKTYVMRSKPGPAAKLPPSAHAIDREFRVMRGLAGSEVPVATMQRPLCETNRSSVARST